MVTNRLRCGLGRGLAVAAVVLGLAGGAARAASDAEFPQGWKDWTLVKEGAIPDNKAPLPPGLPPIVVETVKTYNWINDGKGSAYQIRVNPAAMEAYRKRSGFANGSTAVLDFTDAKVIIVTEHLLDKPLYGVFDYSGKDLSGAHKSLDVQVCTTCHSGFQDACVTGVCSRPAK